jgi:hypothetical protein
MPELDVLNLSDLRPRKRKSRRWQLAQERKVAINLDWRVTGPIWHMLIGASLQFASHDLSLFPLGTFGGRTKPICPNNDNRVLCHYRDYTYILVLARLEN